MRSRMGIPAGASLVPRDRSIGVQAADVSTRPDRRRIGQGPRAILRDRPFGRTVFRRVDPWEYLGLRQGPDPPSQIRSPNILPT